MFEIPPRRKPQDDKGYLEEMTRAVFQVGFSWRVIRDKWLGFVAAFDGFDIASVAGYGEPDVERLLADKDIVRNRRKIEATIHNARTMWDLVGRHGSFHAYLRSLDGRAYPDRRAELCRLFQGMGPTAAFVFLWCVAEDVPAWEERAA